MIKTRHLLLSAALLLVSFGAQAQTQAKMTIESKNGTKLSFQISEINRITWTEGSEGSDTPDGDNYPEIAQSGPVDLGLSVKWASYNIGATSPEGYGDYFAWGETKPYYTEGHSQDDLCSSWIADKSGYNWNSYFDSVNSSSSTFDKYTTNKKTQLELEDDAAHANWGGDWRMPTKAEQDELCEKCTWIWTAYKGSVGYVIVGPSGNAIFLPAAGNRDFASLCLPGSYGDYWSSDLDVNDSGDAFYMYLGSGAVGWYDGSRYRGRSVRAVCP